jgi:hypothetical protein
LVGGGSGGKVQKLGEKESGLMAIPTPANIGHDISSRRNPVPNVANNYDIKS